MSTCSSGSGENRRDRGENPADGRDISLGVTLPERLGVQPSPGVRTGRGGGEFGMELGEYGSGDEVIRLYSPFTLRWHESGGEGGSFFEASSTQTLRFRDSQDTPSGSGRPYGLHGRGTPR
jgi:hypothetical protein